MYFSDVRFTLRLSVFILSLNYSTNAKAKVSIDLGLQMAFVVQFFT